ncbi:MAG: putative DNA binding domain-containing protein, partial [Treponemataceae bacterium]|nr:putative DNA binding domain-containing protein [Treponemataceae bacterium]
MTSERLARLLVSRERETLEFKKAEHQIPDSLYETICAFLNHRGGDILLGVDDMGQVAGIEKETAERFCIDIANATNNSTLFSPPFLLYPQLVQYQGRWIVVVQVPESSQVHKLRGTIYDRSADGDYRLTDPAAIARIVNKKRTYYSEAKVYPFISEKDLSSETLKKARTRLSAVRPNHPWLALDDTAFLKKAGLISRDMETGQEGITLAGILLFGLEETILNILPFYKIDALLKRLNVDRYDDRCYVQTNLIEAYSTLMDFIERSLPGPFYMEQDIR